MLMVYFTAISVTQSTMLNDRLISELERIWKKETMVTYFKALHRHFHGDTEENYEKSRSGYPVSGPRFEPRNSRLQSRSTNHSPVD
jgi:hypothetical protein